MEHIKTRQELEALLKSLSDQGFGYIGDSDPHKRKIEKIINSNNKLNVDVDKDSKFKSSMHSLNDYEEAERVAKEYFSKFSPDDKIFEILDKLYLSSDDSGSMPSNNNPSAKDIVEIVPIGTSETLYATRKKRIEH